MNECCEKPDNLKEVSRVENPDGSITIIRQCRVCNRRHYELDAEPVQLGIQLGNQSKIGVEMIYEIWAEGYATNSERGGAFFLGKEEAQSFKDACDILAGKDNKFAEYYDPNRMTYWGCRLFDNEADARKSFG